MNQGPIGGPMDFSDAGKQMHRLISELYPICRSITGDGFRETLHRFASTYRLRFARCQAEPRSSTGRSPGSGT